MNKHEIKAYLISLGVDNAIWDVKVEGKTVYAVDKNTQLIALIPQTILEL